MRTAISDRSWRAALALVLLCVALPPTAGKTQGGWEWLAPLPRAMTEIVGIAAGGKLYVLAGLQAGEPIGAVDEYQPASDRWTQKRPMPVPAHHVMASERDGKLYVFGGFVRPSAGEGWLPVDRAWEYDPAADSWKALAPMPTPRGAGAAVTVGGKIYVVGGANVPGKPDAPITFGGVHATVGTMEEYDPATDRWRARAAMPTPRNHFTAAAVQGRIYVIGGRVGAVNIMRSSNTDVVEEYDPASDAWALEARTPTARSGSAGAAYQGKIYVVGGEYQNDDVMMAFRAFDAYDPATNRWERLPHMLAPRHGLAAALLGSRLHAAGGDFQSAGVPGVQPHLDSHEVFDFAKW